MADGRKTVVVEFLRRAVFSRENLLVLLLCLAALAVIVLSADQSPAWIYQGF